MGILSVQTSWTAESSHLLVGDLQEAGHAVVATGCRVLRLYTSQRRLRISINQPYGRFRRSL